MRRSNFWKGFLERVILWVRAEALPDAGSFAGFPSAAGQAASRRGQDAMWRIASPARLFFTRKNLFLIAGNPLASPSRFCFRFDRNRSLALGRLPAHGKNAGKARNTPRWERRIRKPVPGNPSFLDGKKFQAASKSYVQPKPVIRHAGAFFRLGE